MALGKLDTLIYVINTFQFLWLLIFKSIFLPFKSLDFLIGHFFFFLGVLFSDMHKELKQDDEEISLSSSIFMFSAYVYILGFIYSFLL